LASTSQSASISQKPSILAQTESSVAVASNVASASQSESSVAVGSDPWGPYVRLDPANWETTVVNDTENVWVVAFTDPHCGACTRLANEWGGLNTNADMLARKVKFGYVDVSVDANNSIIDGYCGGSQVEYTPTVFVYGHEKTKPLEYSGDYKIPSLSRFIGNYCDTNGYSINTASASNPLNEGIANMGMLKMLGDAASNGAFDLPDVYPTFGETNNFGYNAHGQNAIGGRQYNNFPKGYVIGSQNVGGHSLSSHDGGRTTTSGGQYGGQANQYSAGYGAANQSYGADAYGGAINAAKAAAYGGAAYGNAAYGGAAKTAAYGGAAYGGAAYGNAAYGGAAKTAAYGGAAYGGAAYGGAAKTAAYGGAAYGGAAKTYGGYGGAAYDGAAAKGTTYGGAYGATQYEKTSGTVGGAYGASTAYGSGTYGNGAYGAKAYGATAASLYNPIKTAYGAAKPYGTISQADTTYGATGYGAYGDAYGAKSYNNYGATSYASANPLYKKTAVASYTATPTYGATSYSTPSYTKTAT